MRQSKFTVASVNDLHIILIDDDEDDYASVTNLASNVVEKVRSEIGINGRKVFYQDSMGRFDELMINNSEEFSGFIACSGSQQTTLLKHIENGSFKPITLVTD